MRIFVSAALLAASLISAPAFAAPDNWKLDTTHAHILYSVNHLGFSVNHGAFREFDAKLQIDQAKPETAKLEVTVKTASIDSFDKARDEHLRKAEFLDTDKFPEMKFVSTKVKRTGPKTADITGDLTLRGVTKPIVLKAVLNQAGDNPLSKKPALGFSATGSLKRSDFGVSAFVPAVADEVQITIDAEFGKE